MVLKPKFVPWRPALTLTGTSDYAVNTATGQITSHIDTWDALSDNSYLSVSRFATGQHPSCICSWTWAACMEHGCGGPPLDRQTSQCPLSGVHLYCSDPIGQQNS